MLNAPSRRDAGETRASVRAPTHGLSLRVGAVALALALAVSACGPNPADDVPALREAQKADVTASSELAKIDDLVAKGKGKEALALFDGPVAAAMKLSDDRLAAAQPKTEWGKAEHAKLRDLFAARRKAAQHYRAAVEGDQLEEIVKALEEQKPIEKRAAALVSELAAPPPR